jgi:hypothetical protein
MSMTDQELLELAAKAAGMEVKAAIVLADGTLKGIDVSNDGVIIHYWHPLIDDGDALRLAAAIPDVAVVIDNHMGWCGVHLSAERGKYDLVEYFNGDKARSIRLAIVRAAAEIGKVMQAGN